MSKLLASLMRNYFPKRPSGAPLHTLSKLYDVPVGFVTPPPYFEAEYCLFCGRRRVAVARYRMICLVLVNSHLFPLPCGAGSAVPREGFDLSAIILASLLVFPMLGCRHFWYGSKQYFMFLSSGMHIFKHFYLLTLASRGTLPSVFGVKCISCSAGTSICWSLLR